MPQRKRIPTEQMVLEITRRCNMSCAHCLRGEAENIDMDIRTIDLAFQTFRVQYGLCLSGGEPTLALPQIRQVVWNMKSFGWPSAFEFTTNGTKPTPALFRLLNEVECDVCIYISNDKFHRVPNDVVIDRWHSLSRGNNNISIFWDPKPPKRSILDMGRAHDNGIGEREIQNYSNGFRWENGLLEGMLYITATGDVINGCDWSYRRQPRHKLCSLSQVTIGKIKRECDEQNCT